MAGRDAREGLGIGVCAVRNLACSRLGNFQIFFTFNAKNNVFWVVKLKVKVRSLTYSYSNGRLVFNFCCRQPKKLFKRSAIVLSKQKCFHFVKLFFIFDHQATECSLFSFDGVQERLLYHYTTVCDFDLNIGNAGTSTEARNSS